MSKIYFTRHGQTTWNVEDKICGSTDVPLTDKGREQAIELGKVIKDSGIKFDYILYSPLIRAKDTALLISQMTGIEAKEEERLREQNFGRFESTSPRNSEEFKQAKLCFINHYDGGETMLHLCQRIYNLLDDIKNDSEKTYLLVAHNGISRVIESYFNDMTNEEFATFGIKNCELKEYSF